MADYEYDYDNVKVEFDDGIAWLYLNGPRSATR